MTEIQKEQNKRDNECELQGLVCFTDCPQEVTPRKESHISEEAPLRIMSTRDTEYGNRQVHCDVCRSAIELHSWRLMSFLQLLGALAAESSVKIWKNCLWPKSASLCKYTLLPWDRAHLKLNALPEGRFILNGHPSPQAPHEID